MNTAARKLGMLALVLVLVVGFAALMMTPDAYAKGKKPKPPACPYCPETIVIGDMVCTLDACGFDCVYSCPLPFP